MAEPAPDRVPDLDGLRLLVALARTGSIGAAARSVGSTQQAASQRLRAVEARTGLVLARRGARGSSLTPAGVVLAEGAARVLDLVEELGAAVAGLREDGARALAVWASMTVAEAMVPRWLVTLSRRQRGGGAVPTAVSLRAASSADVVEAVRCGAAHVGFVEGPTAPAGLAHADVGHDDLVLVAAAGSPLARRRGPLGPEEVARLTLTGREPGSGTRQVLEAALAAHHLAPADPEAELTTATGVREAVLAGGSPAFVGRAVVARELAAGDLVEVGVRGLDLRRTVRAVWVGRARPPAGPVRELVGVARSSAIRLTPAG